MIINKSSLNSLFRSFKIVFQDALSQAPAMWDKVATAYTSESKQQDYPFMGFIPIIREWIGERKLEDIRTYPWTIANKKWEGTVVVDADDIEDDNIGVYSPLVRLMGERIGAHPDKLVAELLLNGTTQLCYDGQFFFDTDHPVDSGTYSNSFSLALTAANYQTVRASMKATKDDRGGRELNVTPNLLVVPPSLEDAARQIVEAERTSDGGTNTQKGTAEVMVWNRLEDAPTRWYLIDGTKAVKPLIMQFRRQPRMVAKTDPETSDAVFDRDEFIYGTDYRGAAGYGLWQFAATSIAP